MPTIGNYAQQLSMLNQLNMRQASMNKHVNAVATGQKINSAKDDASGFAIGKRMGVEIGSLDQASANTQTGASMLKVADGSLGETLNILQTLKEKALEAANSTANDSDRANIQKVLNQYIDQIDDNSLVDYNGIRLLDGSASGASQTAAQAYTNTSLSTDTDGATKLTDLKSRSGSSLGIQATDTINVSYVKDGKTYSTSYSAGDTKLEDIFKEANKLGGGKVFDENIGSTSEIGVDGSGKTVYTTDGKNAISVKAAEAGTAGSIAGFTISVTDADGNEKKFVNSALDAFSETVAAKDNRSDNSLDLQIGTEAGQSIKADFGNVSARSLGLKGSNGNYLSVGTQGDANAAINVIDNAINKVLDQATNVGSLSSRLEYTHNNLVTQSENVTNAQSTILDADMAKEITGYASDQILLQATQAMLAQSYSNSSWFLNLLG